MATFKAVVITKTETGTALTDFNEHDLMEGDVTLRRERITRIGRGKR